MSTPHTRLTTELRALRARTGLSLAALARTTAYSKSTWERYVNGKALPPRQAVRELCRTAGEPEERLLALWELAQAEWKGRATVIAPAEPAPPQPPPVAPGPPAKARWSPGSPVKLLLALTSAYVVLAAGVALALLLAPLRDTAPGEPLSATHPATSYVVAPRCHGASCEGEDPVRMACTVVPETVSTYRTDTGALVEVRYSEACGAAWARMWGARIGDRVDVTTGGPVREVWVVDSADADAYVYTEMTRARPGSVIRSCFRPEGAGAHECFDALVRPDGSRAG
ncbi:MULTISPECIES: helix-turn-helix domain-containing protein [Streptomyces]|uniref:helix-turn-helix domain-containing protein n=1 Tax=Streptomyces TaxID=1883 RepID=UPI003448AC0B